MLICCVGGVIAQTGRDAYREAYDVWRKAHAELERDAATGGPEQVAQADRAGAAAASFEATRIAHLKSSAEEAAQRRQAIIFQNALTRPSANLEPQAAPGLVASELQTDTRTIARFADDKDRGIQQFRQALEREKVALTALRDSIQVSQKTAAATSAAGAALEESRVKAAQAFGDQAAPLSQTLEQLEKESAAWSDYYEKLAHAIQVANAPPPPINATCQSGRAPSDVCGSCVKTTTSHAPTPGRVSTIAVGGPSASITNVGNMFSNTATSYGPTGSSVGWAGSRDGASGSYSGGGRNVRA
jgi:hypothetical protein